MDIKNHGENILRPLPPYPTVTSLLRFVDNPHRHATPLALEAFEIASDEIRSLF